MTKLKAIIKLEYLSNLLLYSIPFEQWHVAVIGWTHVSNWLAVSKWEGHRSCQLGLGPTVMLKYDAQFWVQAYSCYVSLTTQYYTALSVFIALCVCVYIFCPPTSDGGIMQ